MVLFDVSGTKLQNQQGSRDITQGAWATCSLAQSAPTWPNAPIHPSTSSLEGEMISST